MQFVAQSIAARARAASAALTLTPTETKNAILRNLAVRIESGTERLHAANEADLAEARRNGLPESKLRRLALSAAAVQQMADGLRQVADLPDPVGQVTRDLRMPSGLHVRKVRSPIGVILMIYEARANVTIDAFALCFKSGNACILKGGREAAQSNQALLSMAVASLAEHGAPIDSVQLITSSDREEMKALLCLSEQIDLVIPRGGHELIRFVHEHSRIPMVQHFQGVCHIFVDATADVPKAIDICVSAKTSAPAACNAVETLLVHTDIARQFVPTLADRMAHAGVELRGDATVCRLAPNAVPAADEDWGREFLDLIVAVRIVAGIDEAIAHVRRYGSNHTDAILSRDEANQRRFIEQVQSSCTLVNCSTRFNDGYQLGLGAEIGISTSKIHAYGPMGLEELTTQRYVVVGNGQCR